MTTVLLANATVASASTRVSVAGPSKAHPARAATPPARVAPRPSNSSCAFLARAARLRAATVARAGRAPGGGAERMGDDEVRRGPPGAERDPYRAPDGYEYDYAPPRGAPNGSSPWETAGAGTPPRGPPVRTKAGTAAAAETA